MAARKNAKATETKETTGTERVKSRKGVLTELLLSDIDDRSFENQRTGDFTDGDSPADGSGNSFKELVESIDGSGTWDDNDVHTGMKDPITVRKKAKARRGEPTYEVIKGFRRYAAISQLSQRDSDKVRNPRILVIIKELTDLEALEENIFENTARDNLSGPDLAWAGYNLKQSYEAKGIQITMNQVAQRMGKNQSHLDMLYKMIAAAPDVCKQWRDAKAPLHLKTMKEIAKLPPDQQQDAYDQAIEARAGKGESSKGPGGALQIDIATKKAERLAKIIGAMVKANLVTSGIDWTSAEDLETIGVPLDALSSAEKTEVGKAAHMAFALAVNPPKQKKGAVETAASAEN